MPVLRKIIKIDEEKCNGCGQCVHACHEGAIQLVDGKAKLVSEIYCDGLGTCIGECPQDAITIEERKAEAYDEAATQEHLAKAKAEPAAPSKAPLPCGCPGSMVRELKRERLAAEAPQPIGTAKSELTNWPVQLKLVPTTAPYFRGADVLLVADCVPFALPDFHARFLRGGHPVVVGCPKLDNPDFYVEKLAELIRASGLRSLTVVHMEVPCCSALTRIAETAMSKAGAEVPFRDVTISISGEVLAETGAATA